MNAYRAIDQPGQVVKSTPLASIHCPKALRLESGRLYSLKHEKRAVERSYGQINAPSCDRLASRDDPTVSVFPSAGANSKSFWAVSMQLPTGSRRAFYEHPTSRGPRATEVAAERDYGMSRLCTLPAAMAPRLVVPPWPESGSTRK